MLCGLSSQESLLGTCSFPTGPVVHRLGSELDFSGDMVLLSLEKNCPLLNDQSEIIVPSASHANGG